MLSQSSELQKLIITPQLTVFVPLHPLKPIDTKTDVTKCAFWEYEADSLQGRWATHGCKTVHVNSNATTCSCNHLTHFAILMSSGRANVSEHTLNYNSEIWSKIKEFFNCFLSPVFPRLLRGKFLFMQNKHHVVLFLSHILFSWCTISLLLTYGLSEKLQICGFICEDDGCSY